MRRDAAVFPVLVTVDRFAPFRNWWRAAMFVVLGFSYWAHAGQVDTRGAAIDLSLIPEVRSIRPGKPFRVGLRIHHEPGWHTYWRQPGIVGVPVSLTWDLPAGFHAGPIQWPVPEHVKMGNLNAWGFERDVLLIVEITPPEQLEPRTSIDLRAKGAWMACERTCHPGWGDFLVQLPVRPGAAPDWDPGNHPVFMETEAALPQKLKGWTASVSTEDDGQNRLRIRSDDPAVRADPSARWYFYPYTPHVHSDEPQPVHFPADGSVELTLMPFPIPAPATETLEGLIECSSGLPPGSPNRFAVIQATWRPTPNAP